VKLEVEQHLSDPPQEDPSLHPLHHLHKVVLKNNLLVEEVVMLINATVTSVWQKESGKQDLRPYHRVF
jgi:hypothetical protein